MDPRTKIATCCYCGARTLLSLGGTTERHELVCSSCSAPLHELKQIKTPPPARHAPTERPSKKYHKKSKGRRPKYEKSKKKSRDPSVVWFAKKIFDEIEDIFD